VRLFAIADPHLSAVEPKPMDVFGGAWLGHPARFFEAWRATVHDDDVVLIPGDISWALRLEGALVDLAAIAALPGRKVLLRGNHDYWWPSATKLRAVLPAGMYVVHNDALALDGLVIGGTRGWTTPGSPGFDADDLRIYEREVGRLALSLAAMARLVGRYRVAMMHFPPSNARGERSGFTDLLATAPLDVLVYGHVHGPLPLTPPPLAGLRVEAVAADRLAFVPLHLTTLDPAAPSRRD
jgi:uncharacterized protein